MASVYNWPLSRGSLFVRIVLILEYDGSRYCGWQTQPGGGSIQDALESALSRIACERIQVVTAGRTDTGVHAFYQVVHFDTQVQRPINAWIRGVNTFLPDDIAVLWAAKVSDEFHARYGATDRCYRYFLLNHPVRPGLYHHKVGWFHQPLDIARMQEAAGLFLGQHDFSAFRSAACQAKSPVRTMTKLDISSSDNMIVFELKANAFLQHMVRNIVGCLVYVGKGKYSPTWVNDLLMQRNRSLAAPTFSSAGLYLSGVSYDKVWALPDYAEFSQVTHFPRLHV